MFPFGHGLSYTTCEYSDLVVDSAADPAADTVGVALRIRNTGTRAGQEVVQLYVGQRRPELLRPDEELKAFTKVIREPGAATEIRFELDGRDFAVYDPRVCTWTMRGGIFDLLVGASSRDIRLRGSVSVAAGHASVIQLSRLSPVRDWLRHPVAGARLRVAIGALQRQIFGREFDLVGAEGAGPEGAFVADMPIAKLVMFGVLSEPDLESLIEATQQTATSASAG